MKPTVGRGGADSSASVGTLPPAVGGVKASKKKKGSLRVRGRRKLGTSSEKVSRCDGATRPETKSTRGTAEGRDKTDAPSVLASSSAVQSPDESVTVSVPSAGRSIDQSKAPLSCSAIAGEEQSSTLDRGVSCRLVDTGAADAPLSSSSVVPHRKAKTQRITEESSSLGSLSASFLGDIGAL